MLEAEEALSGANLDAANAISALKLESASRDKDLAAMYDSKLAEMRKDADARRRNDVQAIETAMSAQIQVVWSLTTLLCCEL